MLNLTSPLSVNTSRSSTSSTEIYNTLGINVQMQNEMLVTENASLRDRMCDVERRLGEQEDEMVCLRSTVAQLVLKIEQMMSGNASKNSTPVKTSVRCRAPSPTGKPPLGPSPSPSMSIPQPLQPAIPRTSPKVVSGLKESSAQIAVLMKENGYYDHSNIQPANQRRANHQSIDHPNSRLGGPLSSVLSQSLSSVSSSNHSSSNHNRRDGECVYMANAGLVQIRLNGHNINVLLPSARITNFSLQPPNPAPTETLTVEWIHGYRGKDCRNNLHWLPTGELIYNVCRAVVLFNPTEHTQRHYLEHTDQVQCVRVQPGHLLVASAQSGSHAPASVKAHIRIWDTISLKTQSVLGLEGAEFDRGVSCVAFSKVDGGRLLAAVDQGYEHTLSLWDWSKAKKLVSCKSANDVVLSVEFHPMTKSRLVTCGKGHLSVWHFDGVTLQKTAGLLEGRDKPKYVLCMAYSDNAELWAGDSNGTITVWGTAESTKPLKQIEGVHSGGVFSVVPNCNGDRMLSGGGRDGRIMEWASETQQLLAHTQLCENEGGVRTIAITSHSQLFVGTTQNCIWSGTLTTGLQSIQPAHHSGLVLVCAHPNQQQYWTAGNDQSICLWDGISNKRIWQLAIPESVSCGSVSPNGECMLIGCLSGQWLLIELTARQVILARHECSSALCCVLFSPSGQAVLITSSIGRVSLYTCTSQTRKMNRISSINLGDDHVTCADWSVDGKLIRVNTRKMNIIYFFGDSLDVCEQLSMCRDSSWATCHCHLSHDTLAIPVDNNHPVLTQYGQLIVSSCQSDTALTLQRYPCDKPKSGCKTYCVHSSPVTGLCYLANGSRVVSIDGTQGTVIQWKVSDSDDDQ